MLALCACSMCRWFCAYLWGMKMFTQKDCLETLDIDRIEADDDKQLKALLASKKLRRGGCLQIKLSEQSQSGGLQAKHVSKVQRVLEASSSFPVVVVVSASPKTAAQLCEDPAIPPMLRWHVSFPDYDGMQIAEQVIKHLWFRLIIWGSATCKQDRHWGREGGLSHLA